jgi:hypothetical protein
MKLDLRRVRDASIVVVALRVLYGAVLFAAQYMVTDLPAHRHGPPSDGAGVLEWLHWIVINPWLHRDSHYYLLIARDGYSVEAGTTAFHPLFPLTSWLAGLPFGSAGLGMLIVGTAAAIGATVMIARYVAQVHGEEWSQPAGWAFLLMPGGVIWLLLYTEAMFVAFAVATLLMLHRGEMLKAGVFGALATLTRQQGILLGLPMLWVFWTRRRDVRGFGSMLLLPAAYAAYAGYRLFVLYDVDFGAVQGVLDGAHSFLISDAAQEIAPGQRIAWPWEPLAGHVTQIMKTGQTHLVLDILLGLGYIALLGVERKRLTAVEQLFCAGVIGVAICYYNGDFAPYMALPRHVVVAFPLAYLLGRWAAQKKGVLLIAGGVAFNALLALLFGTLKWIP